jgi:P-type conjugative transfer protein TrbL
VSTTPRTPRSTAGRTVPSSLAEPVSPPAPPARPAPAGAAPAFADVGTFAAHAAATSTAPISGAGISAPASGPTSPAGTGAADAPAAPAAATRPAPTPPPAPRSIAARAARVAATFAPRTPRFTLVLLAAGFLCLTLPAWARAQGPPNDGILDGIVRGYQDQSATWLARIQPLAQRTFALLATLELAVSGLFWALGRESLDAVAAALLRKFIVLAALFSLLTLFQFWIPAITDSFQAAGQTVSATSVVNPSAVLDLGGTIASKMLISFGALGFLVNPVGVLLGSFTAFFVVISFGLIAAQLCLTLVETYLVLSGGALFLGFAGFRGTAPLAEGYLVYAFQVGAKIYLLYLLLGVGMGIAQQWAMLDFSPGFDIAPPSLITHFQVMCGAMIFCLLTWYIPRTLASRLVQGVSFRLAEAIR